MYSQEALATALKAVKCGMPKRMVSKTFNVPRATIQFRLKNKNAKQLPGPKSVLLKEEEDTLVEWMLESFQKGFPNRRIDLILSVANIIKQTDRKNPFKNGVPGKKWYCLFLQRHPELSGKMPEPKPFSSTYISEEDIREWFTHIESFLTRNGHSDILEDSTRIFNGDELSFPLCPKSGAIMALKGETDTCDIDHASANSYVTVIVTFGGNGDITQPLVVFPNKIFPRNSAEDVGESILSLNDSRWMKAEQFYDYIQNVFHPFLLRTQRKFPVVLFVNADKTPHTLDISELCKSLDIILIALYPNATKLLEPDDAATFCPLKLAWQKTVMKWRREHPKEALTKKNFVPVLKEALENGIPSSAVTNGFKATGLCPWNPEAVNFKKCVKKENSDDEEIGTIVLQVTDKSEDEDCDY